MCLWQNFACQFNNNNNNNSALIWHRTDRFKGTTESHINPINLQTYQLILIKLRSHLILIYGAIYAPNAVHFHTVLGAKTCFLKNNLIIINLIFCKIMTSALFPFFIFAQKMRRICLILVKNVFFSPSPGVFSSQNWVYQSWYILFSLSLSVRIYIYIYLD